MKKVAFGVFMVLTMFGVSSALDTADVRSGGGREYVIFPAEYTLPLPVQGYTRSELTKQQAKKADDILWAHLAYEANSLVDIHTYNLDAKRIVENVNPWKGQFFGLKDRDGHDVAFVLYSNLPAAGTFDVNAWRNRMLEGSECGPAYFVAKVDLVEQKVKDFKFNVK